MIEEVEEVSEAVLEISEVLADIELVVMLVDLEELDVSVEAELESEVSVDVGAASDVRGSEFWRGVIGYSSHRGSSRPRDL